MTREIADKEGMEDNKENDEVYNGKPLIFVQPLSETAQKLEDVFERTAKEDKIEIHKVTKLQELGQLVPNLPQSLTVFTNIKKCALFLQNSKKMLKRTGSKILLINSKALPRKTIVKLEKLGLTEYIQEPVAPKTLMYKVNLILKALTTKKESQEFNARFSEDEQAAEENDKLAKKKKKKQEEETEGEDLYQKEAKEEEAAEDLYAKNPKPAPVVADEDPYDPNASSYFDDDDDDEPAPAPVIQSKPADDVGGNYGGAIYDTTLDDESGYLQGEKPYEEYTEEELDLDSIKRKINLEIDEDINKEREENAEDELDIPEAKKAKVKLDLEDDEADDELDEDGEDELEEPVAKKSKISLDLEDEGPAAKAEENVAEELDEGPKRPAGKLQLVDDEADEAKAEDTTDQLAAPEKKAKVSLELTEDEAKEAQAEEAAIAEDLDEKPAKKAQLNLVDEDKEDKKSEALAPIDTSDMKGKVDLQEGDLGGHYKGKVGLQETLPESKERPKVKPQAAETLDEAEKAKEQAEVAAADFRNRLRDEAPVAAEDSGLKKKTVEASPEALDKKKAQLEEALPADWNNRDTGAGPEAAAEKAATKLAKPEAAPELNAKKLDPNKKAETGTSERDKVEKEIDQNWDTKRDKKVALSETDKLRRNDEGQAGPGKASLGEQTINYEEVKKAHAASEYGKTEKPKSANLLSQFLSSVEKKEASLDLAAPVAAAEGLAKVVAPPVQALETIYRPEPYGLHYAIRILELYYEPDQSAEVILAKLSRFMFKEFQALVSFFIFRPKQSQASAFYEGHPVWQAFLTESQAQTMNKEIWKELKKTKFGTWGQTTLPEWSDKTFKQKNIEFIYPYKEGSLSLGFVVAHFPNGINEAKIREVEMLLETARGLYLEVLHQANQRADYEGSKAQAEGTSKIKSFFGKFFSKAS